MREPPDEVEHEACCFLGVVDELTAEPRAAGAGGHDAGFAFAVAEVAQVAVRLGHEIHVPVLPVGRALNPKPLERGINSDRCALYARYVSLGPINDRDPGDETDE